MKSLFLIACLITTTVFSQPKLTGYLELKARFNFVRDGLFIEEIAIPKRLENKIDSLIDYKAIKKIIAKNSSPANVLNALSIEGWSLVSVTQATDIKDGKPDNYPFMLYYLKREFVIPDKKE